MSALSLANRMHHEPTHAMTLRQLQQVALTYVTRPNEWGWLFAILYAIVAVYAVNSLAPSREPVRFSDVVFVLLLLGVAPPVACRQHALVWQFAHPRAAVTPGFVGAHLAIVGIVAVLSMLVLPLAVAHATGSSAWFALAIVAAGVLFAGAPNSLLALTGPAMALSTRPDTENFIDVAPWMAGEGERLYLLIAMTLGAWALTIRGVLRAATGREETTPWAPAVWGGTNERSAQPFRAAKALAADAPTSGIGAAIASRQIDRIIARMARWRGRNQRKLVLAMFPPVAAKFYPAGVLAGLAVMVVMLFKYEAPFQLDQDRLEALIGLLPMISSFGALLPATVLANRLPQMSLERLLPMSNSEYSAALLINCARRSLLIWLVPHALVLVAICALPWQDVPLPSAGTMAAYVGLSWAGMTLTFGATACCLLAPNIFTILFTALIGIAAMLGLPAWWADLSSFDSRIPVALAALLCFGVGVMLIHHAFIAWREKEFG